MSRLFSCLLTALIVVQGAAAHELTDLVADGAEVVEVAGGCRFTEGPAFSPKGFLLFSDIPNSRILRLQDDGALAEFLKPSGKANGLVFDASGMLYACQGGARRVVRIDPKHPSEPVVLAESFDDKKLNSPNDLALDDHGGVYFTDPRYGGEDDLEQSVMGVYYISKSGDVTRVIDKLVRPNGVLVSQKGEWLYVAEPNKRELYRYSIKSPGKVGEGELIFTGDPSLDGGGPDGMALDEHGNIYATYKGIVVLDPNGKLVGRVATPKNPANCTFGGDDGKTLFITARESLLSLRMKVVGMPLRKNGPVGKAATSTVKLKSLALEIPTRWKRTPPTSRMRLGQFSVPAAKGDPEGAEFVVFHFPGGGSIDDNARRWINQFAREDRKGKIHSGRCEDGLYAIVDLEGTYMRSVGPPIRRQTEPKKGWRVVNVVIAASDGMYFLKLAGPKATSTGAMEELRKSFGASAEEKTEEIK